MLISDLFRHLARNLALTAVYSRGQSLLYLAAANRQLETTKLILEKETNSDYVEGQLWI